jgi:hypothetical protein
MEFFFQVASRFASTLRKYLTVKFFTSSSILQFPENLRFIANDYHFARNEKHSHLFFGNLEMQVLSNFQIWKLPTQKYMKNSYSTPLTAGTQKVIMTLVIIKTKNLKSGNAEM